MVWFLAWWSSWTKTSHKWWVLHFCFSIVLPYSHIHTNMLPEHRDAIHWGLWAQYMYFIGLEEAPNITTGRPLWAAGCWEISVKSHQGFISFWPCQNFFLVLRGTRGTVGEQEDCVHCVTASWGPDITPDKATGQPLQKRRTTWRRDKVLMNDNSFKWRHTKALFKCYQTDIQHLHIFVRWKDFVTLTQR